MSIAEYELASARADQLPEDALTPVRLGLFGEVGQPDGHFKEASS